VRLIHAEGHETARPKTSMRMASANNDKAKADTEHAHVLSHTLHVYHVCGAQHAYAGQACRSLRMRFGSSMEFLNLLALAGCLTRSTLVRGGRGAEIPAHATARISR
jgi:hypothetical protein